MHILGFILFFLLFCFLFLVIGALAFFKRIFGVFRQDKSKKQQEYTYPQKSKKKFDYSQAEDVEYEEIEDIKED